MRHGAVEHCGKHLDNVPAARVSDIDPEIHGPNRQTIQSNEEMNNFRSPVGQVPNDETWNRTKLRIDPENICKITRYINTVESIPNMCKDNWARLLNMVTLNAVQRYEDPDAWGLFHILSALILNTKKDIEVSLAQTINRRIKEANDYQWSKLYNEMRFPGQAFYD